MNPAFAMPFRLPETKHEALKQRIRTALLLLWGLTFYTEIS